MPWPEDSLGCPDDYSSGRDWPDEWNVEDSLFAFAAEEGLDLEWPAPSPRPPVQKSTHRTEMNDQMPDGLGSPLPPGVLSNRFGLWAELLTDAKVVELGGFSDKPSADDRPYDRLIRFGDDAKPKSAQIKGVRLRDGQAKTYLGPRVGHRTQVDKRRKVSYRGRAEVFIIVVVAECETLFYVFPAKRLEGRTTLTITPGRRRKRRGWKQIEPEAYREAWHHCTENMAKADLVPIFGVAHGPPVISSKRPMGHS